MCILELSTGKKILSRFRPAQKNICPHPTRPVPLIHILSRTRTYSDFDAIHDFFYSKSGIKILKTIRVLCFYFPRSQDYLSCGIILLPRFWSVIEGSYNNNWLSLNEYWNIRLVDNSLYGFYCHRQNENMIIWSNYISATISHSNQFVNSHKIRNRISESISRMAIELRNPILDRPTNHWKYFLVGQRIAKFIFRSEMELQNQFPDRPSSYKI